MCLLLVLSCVALLLQSIKSRHRQQTASSSCRPHHPRHAPSPPLPSHPAWPRPSPPLPTTPTPQLVDKLADNETQIATLINDEALQDRVVGGQAGGVGGGGSTTRSIGFPPCVLVGGFCHEPCAMNLPGGAWPCRRRCGSARVGPGCQRLCHTMCTHHHCASATFGRPRRPATFLTHAAGRSSPPFGMLLLRCTLQASNDDDLEQGLEKRRTSTDAVSARTGGTCQSGRGTAPASLMHVLSSSLLTHIGCQAPLGRHPEWPDPGSCQPAHMQRRRGREQWRRLGNRSACPCLGLAAEWPIS